jgi:hypothetical protein
MVCLSLFNDILRTERIPKLFKQAKVITILKPGKDCTDTLLVNFAAQYRFQITSTYDSSTNPTSD